MTHIIAFALVVHLTNAGDVPVAIMRAAQQQVTDMFAEIGVDVRWAPDGCPSRGHVDILRLTVLPYETGALRRHRGAVLGAAMPSANGIGTAWVFYQRVVREAERHGVAAAPVLAGAIAHEIGHLLQRSPGHAERGVMRATWNHADYLRSANGLLRFTPDDALQFGNLASTSVQRD